MARDSLGLGHVKLIKRNSAILYKLLGPYACGLATNGCFSVDVCRRRIKSTLSGSSNCSFIWLKEMHIKRNLLITCCVSVLFLDLLGIYCNLVKLPKDEKDFGGYLLRNDLESVESKKQKNFQSNSDYYYKGCRHCQVNDVHLVQNKSE
uniref:Uncharacterized protein n=1 Tax=Lactuca sativa TaxID=4236 RepID=A0A9R1W636_LACSA|nr:hypothetical protein LSAT_V11C300109360 [Lactuca sativa]